MQKKVLIAICPLAKPAEVKIINASDITINFMKIENILSQEAFTKLTQPASKLNWNFLVVIMKLDVRHKDFMMHQVLKYMVFDHQAGIIDFGGFLTVCSDVPEEVQATAAQMIDSAIGAIKNAPCPKANQIPPTTQIFKEIIARITSSIASETK